MNIDVTRHDDPFNRHTEWGEKWDRYRHMGYADLARLAEDLLSAADDEQEKYDAALGGKLEGVWTEDGKYLQDWVLAFQLRAHEMRGCVMVLRSLMSWTAAHGAPVKAWRALTDQEKDRSVPADVPTNEYERYAWAMWQTRSDHTSGEAWAEDAIEYLGNQVGTRPTITPDAFARNVKEYLKERYPDAGGMSVNNMRQLLALEFSGRNGENGQNGKARRQL